MEQICFAPNEACPHEVMIKQAKVNPWCFIVAADSESGRLAGLINGFPSDEERFIDEFFTSSRAVERAGKNTFICGLEVLPEHRGRGIASELMRAMIARERAAGRESIILTCHEHLVSFYNQFGFESLGQSESTWGGVNWMEMKLKL